jgi:hypothetical protein
MKSCGTETRAKQQRFISIREVGPSMHTGRQAAPDSFTGGSESGNSKISIRRLIGDQVILWGCEDDCLEAAKLSLLWNAHCTAHVANLTTAVVLVIILTMALCWYEYQSSSGRLYLLSV